MFFASMRAWTCGGVETKRETCNGEGDGVPVHAVKYSCFAGFRSFLRDECAWFWADLYSVAGLVSRFGVYSIN